MAQGQLDPLSLAGVKSRVPRDFAALAMIRFEFVRLNAYFVSENRLTRRLRWRNSRWIEVYWKLIRRKR
jgi:hypothetical protein